MRLVALILSLAASPVLAASEEAWERFRKDVETACTAFAPGRGETAIEVNPFGSEHYGAALLITTFADGGVDRHVCIYDKQSGTAELTAPFTPPQEVVEPQPDAAGNLVPMRDSKTGAHLVKP